MLVLLCLIKSCSQAEASSHNTFSFNRRKWILSLNKPALRFRTTFRALDKVVHKHCYLYTLRVPVKSAVDMLTAVCFVSWSQGRQHVVNHCGFSIAGERLILQAFHKTVRIKRLAHVNQRWVLAHYHIRSVNSLLQLGKNPTDTIKSQFLNHTSPVIISQHRT